MNLLLFSGVSFLAINLFRVIKSFSDKYEILVANKEDFLTSDEMSSSGLNLRPENYDHAIDLRGTPTHLCVCGSQIWNVKVVFDNFEIGTYFLDMECANCGSIATAPTPVDRTEM